MPLSVVFALIRIDQSSDAVLEVVLEITGVDIAVGVGVLALAGTQLHEEGITPSL